MYRNKKIKRLTIEVGGIPILFSISYFINERILVKKYKDFLSKKRPTITIHIHYKKISKIIFSNKNFIFGLEKSWGYYCKDRKHVFVFEPRCYNSLKKKELLLRLQGNKKSALRFISPLLLDWKEIKKEPFIPYRLAIFNHNFSKGDIFSDHDLSFSDSLSHPLPLVFLLNIMPLFKGIVFHGACVIDGDRSYLFLGESQSGKSTMAKIWQKERIVLHDDRIIVRRQKSNFLAFATPWFNGISQYSKGIILDKIFFLRHSLNNEVSRKIGGPLLLKIISNSFLPIWNREKLNFSVGLCGEIAKRIPCYELGFFPDHRVIEFIRSLR